MDLVGDILKIAVTVVLASIAIIREIRKVHVLVNSANDRLKSEIADLKKIVEAQAIEIGLLREREVK